MFGKIYIHRYRTDEKIYSLSIATASSIEFSKKLRKEFS